MLPERFMSPLGLDTIALKRIYATHPVEMRQLLDGRWRGHNWSH